MSLDFELMVGWHDLDESIRLKTAKGMADIKSRIHRLIDLLEKHDLKCTWATAGHLFGETCQSHADYPDKHWLRNESQMDSQQAPLWYAPDLIQRLIDSRVRNRRGHTEENGSENNNFAMEFSCLCAIK